MTEPPRKRMVKPPTGGLEGGRGKPARLKTAKERTPSQQAWLERQINDPFAAKARALGYRSRAAFKISEIDDRFRLFKRGARIVDLGLAPGGWTQVAIERGVTDALRRLPGAVIAIWYPITDRARTDGLQQALVALDVPALFAELHIAGDGSLLRMKGCGLLVLNPPWQIESEFRAVLPTFVERLRVDPGAKAECGWLVPEK